MKQASSTIRDRLEWGVFAGLVIGFYGMITVVTAGQGIYSKVTGVRRTPRRGFATSVTAPSEK